jgi:hypothetical protein
VKKVLWACQRLSCLSRFLNGVGNLLSGGVVVVQQWKPVVPVVGTFETVGRKVIVQHCVPSGHCCKGAKLTSDHISEIMI